MRRKPGGPAVAEQRQRQLRSEAPPYSGEDVSKQESVMVSTAINNGEDLAPFVRRAFVSGKPETLLQSLRQFSRSKEAEIEEVCKSHYQDFIRAVDDLRSLLSDVESLKSSLQESNSVLQSVAGPLLSSLDAYVEAHTQSRNLAVALASARLCVRLFELCRRANEHLTGDNLYMALRCVDAVEHGGFLDSAPSPAIRRMLDSVIPAIRSHAERRISLEFRDWLVKIRVVSRNLGQIAIGRASAARQREEDLRTKLRQSEDLRSGSISGDSSSFTLLDEDVDDVAAAAAAGDLDSSTVASGSGGGDVVLGLDLTPLHRAYHIHQTLGLQERFKQYYFENRKLQLTSDFQVSSSMTPFLESHQTFFAQIAGFFIVEDRILRTGGGLISKFEVDSLWDTAVSKMVSVLEDQFSRMQTASHLLLVKDYVSLLGVTLRKYGYTVEPLHDVLGRYSDKYHDLLLADCRKKISDALAADNLTQMIMRKEYEYSMNVTAFNLQTTDILPAFPYVAPFSSIVPESCRIVRSFIGDSVSFMTYGGHFDFYHVVNKYLDRLLTDVFDGTLLMLVESSLQGVSQAMQTAANMVVFERACDFFFCHVAQLSGIPLRMVERGRREFPLQRSRDAAEAKLVGFLRSKIDEFMDLTENVNWMTDEPPQNGNEYANEVIIYLETIMSTAQQILPFHVHRRVLIGVFSHISEKVVGVFLMDYVKRFNENAVIGIDTDLKLFESFADTQAQLLGIADDSDINEFKLCMLEARQMLNLLMSNSPDNYMNPVIREKNYNKLDYKKVVAISERFKDSSDQIFGRFGSRAARQHPKKKSLDSLIKKLKDVG